MLGVKSSIFRSGLTDSIVSDPAPPGQKKLVCCKRGPVSSEEGTRDDEGSSDGSSVDKE